MNAVEILLDGLVERQMLSDFETDVDAEASNDLLEFLVWLEQQK